jgi:hypothetical protein
MVLEVKKKESIVILTHEHLEENSGVYIFKILA